MPLTPAGIRLSRVLDALQHEQRTVTDTEYHSALIPVCVESMVAAGHWRWAAKRAIKHILLYGEQAHTPAILLALKGIVLPDADNS